MGLAQQVMESQKRISSDQEQIRHLEAQVASTVSVPGMYIATTTANGILKGPLLRASQHHQSEQDIEEMREDTRAWDARDEIKAAAAQQQEFSRLKKTEATEKMAESLISRFAVQPEAGLKPAGSLSPLLPKARVVVDTLPIQQANGRQQRTAQMIARSNKIEANKRIEEAKAASEKKFTNRAAG